ncbi:MAG: RluA family pseudouridine synthase [Alphaproteobacteria bacterium]|nr:MAG: RluA family pseudouridine synthase [Alphaproteobacteria bacterium]
MCDREAALNKKTDETSPLHLVVGAEGARIDRHLAIHFPDLSRSRLKALLMEGKVTLNGATITDPSYRVKQGDEIEITLPPPAPAEPEPQKMDLDVVYEDSDVIVINKPAGLVVHPGAGTPDGTLVNALLAHCGASLSGIGGVARPGIVHRIDKDTSGLIVVAKNDKAHQSLAAQFEEHSVERSYLALVWGDVRQLTGTIESQIARSKNNRKKMAVVKSAGRHAVTHYKVLERFGPPGGAIATLVECRLETGRTHQIRVHMAQLGHTLIGDPLYGSQRKRAPATLPEETRTQLEQFPRQALHARTLGFEHPSTGEFISFDSETPNDFKTLINSLRAIP